MDGSRGARRYDKEYLLWQSTVAIKSDPVGTQAHSEPGTLTKLTDETAYPGERLICPTVFPASRRCKAILRKLPWLDKIEPSAFQGGHVVVTVPPGGKTFKIAYVDAGDEKMSVMSEREMAT